MIARLAPLTGADLILIDTSVWIEVFRKPSRVRLGDEVDFDDVVTCLPVIQEVLQGFRDEAAFRLAKRSLSSLPVVESPLHQEVFEEAAQLYRAGRRKGLTVRSGTDCLIAACALRHGLTVLHHDRDFPKIARISPLQERDIFR